MKTWALLGFDDNVNRLVRMQRNDREELFKLSVNTLDGEDTYALAA